MPSKEKHKLVQLAEAFGADGTKATKLVNEKIDLWKEGGVGLDPKAKGSAVEIVDGLIQFLTMKETQVSERITIPRLLGPDDPGTGPIQQPTEPTGNGGNGGSTGSQGSGKPVHVGRGPLPIVLGINPPNSF